MEKKIKKLSGHTISNSKATTYQTCPRMVELHYDLGLRARNTSSSLVYGSAIDKGLSKLLLGGTLAEALEDFAQAMIWNEIAGELVHIPSNQERVSWQKSDYDSCFVPEDEKGAEETETNVWTCLYYKGQESIKAYHQAIMPRLSNIHSVQKLVELENEEGDRINGFIDFIADVDGIGPFILDNKTSDSPYKEIRVRTSQQLSLYSADTGILKAGFVVLLKKPARQDENGKRFDKPQIRIQLLTDELDEDMVNLALEGVHRISDAIKSKVFPPNFNACDNVYGKRCSYYDYCHNGKSTEGLVKVERKK